MGLETLNGSWWHVVWNTFLAWPPKDHRGNWQELSQFYTDLSQQYGEIEAASPLPSHWQGRPLPAGTVRLSPELQAVLAESIYELAESDRVAGDTPVRALAIDPLSVQIVLACPQELLHQKVGRLKSRSATLLSFTPGSGLAGPGTWGKGFWWARLRTEEILGAAESFVRQGRGTQTGAPALS